jgi:hypothetical protein
MEATLLELDYERFMPGAGVNPAAKVIAGLKSKERADIRPALNY